MVRLRLLPVFSYPREVICSIAVTELSELMLIVLTVVEVHVHVPFCHN